MNITLRQLRAFLMIARHGSFTLAAKNLHVTQSALSGLLKELENALEVKLVNRDSRNVQLSNVGREIFPRIEKIIRDLDQVMNDIDNLRTLKSGTVRIAAPQLMACTFLPEVIAAYSKKYPEVKVYLLDCDLEHVIPNVLSGIADFGIGPERSLATDIISAQMLFEMPFMVVFPEQHPLGDLKQITWKDVIRYPLIVLQGKFIEQLSFDVYSASKGAIRFDTKYTVTFMSTALSMVDVSMGVTICLPYAASMVKLYRVQMRLINQPVIYRKFFILNKKNDNLSPAADSFITFLFQYNDPHGRHQSGNGSAAG